MSVKENILKNKRFFHLFILKKRCFTKEHRTPPEGGCERPEQTGSYPVGFRAQKL
jgi:hypothetical protein